MWRTCLWRWNRHSVPKRRHIKFRHQGITQKKTYNIQNMAKVWNQDNSVIPDAAVHNGRPDMVLYWLNLPNSYVNVCSSSWQPQPSQRRQWEAAEVCRLERWAYNKMAAQHGQYNTATAVHRGYYYRQIAGKSETVWSPHCSIYCNADSSNTQYMTYS